MTSKHTFKRAAEAFEQLCHTIQILRQECPWDKVQTLHSLGRYLLEEAYELHEVMNSGPQEHCEELGDLLFQIVFQAQIRSENDKGFDIAQVATVIREKLEWRHPHVFDKNNPERQGLTWTQIKVEEKLKKQEARPTNNPHSFTLSNIPRGAPALLRALLVGEAAAKVGFDWPDLEGVRKKVLEEWEELKQEINPSEKPPSKARQQEEFGDLLFALVSYGRHLKLDPEAALHNALERFDTRFRKVEDNTEQPLLEHSLDSLEALWQKAKEA